MSAAGDTTGKLDGEKLECGICWHVYDPAEGDSVWQVPPGTKFEELPDEWRCPVCDAPQTKFMRLDHDRG